MSSLSEESEVVSGNSGCSAPLSSPTHGRKNLMCGRTTVDAISTSMQIGGQAKSGALDWSRGPASVLGFEGSRLNAKADQLKGALAVAQRGLHVAEVEVWGLEAERARLADKVGALEADRRKLQDELMRRQHRCLQLERECATLASRLDLALPAEDAEKDQTRDAIPHASKLCIDTAGEKQSPKPAVPDDSEAVSRLKAALATQVSGADALREELRTARVHGAALQEALNQVTSESEVLGESFWEANQQTGATKAKAARLEGELGDARSKQADLSAEAEILRRRCQEFDSANQRLRLDLQEAICQVVRTNEVPFYQGCGGIPAFTKYIAYTACDDLPNSAAENPPDAPPPLVPKSARGEGSKSGGRTRQLFAALRDARAHAVGAIEELGQAPGDWSSSHSGTKP